MGGYAPAVRPKSARKILTTVNMEANDTYSIEHAAHTSNAQVHEAANQKWKLWAEEKMKKWWCENRSLEFGRIRGEYERRG